MDRIDKKAGGFQDKMSNDNTSSDLSAPKDITSAKSLFKRRSFSFQVMPCGQESHLGSKSRKSEGKPVSTDKRNQKSTTDSEEKDRTGADGGLNLQSQPQPGQGNAQKMKRPIR